MDTYTTVKNRLLLLCEEKGMSIHKLATESAVPPFDHQKYPVRQKP